MKRQVWGILVLVLMAAPTPAGAVVLINEVLADPAGDANGDGLVHSTQDEFVELVNTGSSPVTLNHWTLSDALQVRHNFDAGAIIPAFGLLVIFGGGSPADLLNAVIASAGTLALNNAGDTVTLRDADGALSDLFTFGAAGGQDVSLTRFPDATGPFVLHTAANGDMFSPGLTVTGQSSLPHPEPEPSLPPPSGLPAIPEPSSFWLLGLGLSRWWISRSRA